MNHANKRFIIVIVVIVVAVMGWAFLTMPDQRTGGEKIGDAIDAMPQGPTKAYEQLQDRTPGERLGDAVEETGQDIKRATDR